MFPADAANSLPRPAMDLILDANAQKTPSMPDCVEVPLKTRPRRSSSLLKAARDAIKEMMKPNNPTHKSDSSELTESTGDDQSCEKSKHQQAFSVEKMAELNASLVGTGETVGVWKPTKMLLSEPGKKASMTAMIDGVPGNIPGDSNFEIDRAMADHEMKKTEDQLMLE